MFGSSSTTSSRASGRGAVRRVNYRPRLLRSRVRKRSSWLRACAPQTGAALDATCELPEERLSRRATWRGRAASSRSRGAAPGPGPTGRAGRRGWPGRRPDSAATQAKTSSPSGRSSAATASASSVLSPGGVSPRCSQRTATPSGAASGCSSAGAGHLEQGDPAGGRRGRGEDPADRRQRGLVAGQEQVRRPAGRRAAPAPATPSRAPGAAAAAQAAAGPSPCRTKSISTSAAAGVLAAGGVAAQAHPVGALRPDDPPVLGDPRPPRCRVADPRDQQVDGGAGRRHGGGGAGEDHPAHRRGHVRDGDDGQHVDRPETVVGGGGGSGHVPAA